MRAECTALGGMEVWLFVGADGLHALTGREDGSNLPSDLGPWKPRRAVELDSAEPDDSRAIELIAEHGYCCFV